MIPGSIFRCMKSLARTMIPHRFMPVWILALCSFALLHQSAAAPLPDSVKEMMLRSGIFQALADETSSDDLLIGAHRAIPIAVPESPEFWSRIVKGTRFSQERQDFALMMLFRRHIHPGMTLGEMARIFEGHDWAKIEHIEVAGMYSSMVPQIWLEASPFFVRKWSSKRDAVHRAVLVFENGNRMEKKDILAALRGQVDPGKRHLPLIDIRVSSPHLGGE